MISNDIKTSFDQAKLDNLYTVYEIGNSVLEKQIRDVCNRPEFKPLLAGIRIALNSHNDQPFLIEGTDMIRLNSSDFEEPAVVAFRLRHGVELITLQRLLASKLSTKDDYLALSLLAFHTSLSNYGLLLAEEKEKILKFVMHWEINALEFVDSGKFFSSSAGEITEFISGFINYLLPLQGSGSVINDFSAVDIQEACAIAMPLLKIAHPTERLLTMGGDDRLHIDSATGLNEYGCSPMPRPWAATFSSCTASSISYYAYKKAEALRQTLIKQAFRGDFLDCFVAALENVRKQLTEVLTIDALDAEVIFTGSGTDGEFFALYFALGSKYKKCLNILIAPSEVGRGSLLAAAGQHYRTTATLGRHVDSGIQLEGFSAWQIRVECLPIRRDSGEIIATEEIDDSLDIMVEQAIKKDENVLIHLLDCSKTGLTAPSIAAVTQLKYKYPDKVCVVVDAAQVRMSRNMLRQYLSKGFMVLTTGSKFFTGPPFSGALIVPEQLFRNIQQFGPLLPGFSAYCTRYEFPPNFKQLGNHLSKQPNVGLLMRWQAALWEMSVFFSVPSKQRYQTLMDFSQILLDSIKRMPEFELINAPVRVRKIEVTQKCWDIVPSIFTFLLKKQDKNGGVSKPLSYEDCRRVYHWLNRDITFLIPPAATPQEHALALCQCHTGQPVKIKRINDKWIGGLRIASGARLVSGVCYDDMLGKTPEDRLIAQVSDMQTILNKVSIILKYWDSINGVDCQSDRV